MMGEVQNYAVIDTASGIVVNTIVWDGEPPWAPPDGCAAVQSNIAAIGWSYADGVFSPPPEVAPSPTDILASNQYQQASLLSQASQAMAPVLVSLQLGDATDAETTTAKAWQAYYRALQAVDLTQASPVWPVAPIAI